MGTFNPSASHPARAVQAWQILVGMAHNRQTITYEGLSELMYGKSAAGVLAQILGHVAFYCEDNNLPPLTAIVVKKDSGAPGAEIPVQRQSIDEQREKVYQHDWFDVYPPSESEFTKSFSKHVK